MSLFQSSSILSSRPWKSRGRPTMRSVGPDRGTPELQHHRQKGPSHFKAYEYPLSPLEVLYLKGFLKSSHKETGERYIEDMRKALTCLQAPLLRKRRYEQREGSRPLNTFPFSVEIFQENQEKDILDQWHKMTRALNKISPAFKPFLDKVIFYQEISLKNLISSSFLRENLRQALEVLQEFYEESR